MLTDELSVSTLKEVESYIRVVIHNKLSIALTESNPLSDRTSFTTDLVQELLAKLAFNIESWGSLDRRTRCKYVATAAHNATSNFIRDTVNSRSQFTNKDCKLFPVRNGTDETLLLREIFEVLRDSLSDEEMKIMPLLIAGCTYGEISEILEISFNKVRLGVAKARAVLEKKGLDSI